MAFPFLSAIAPSLISGGLSLLGGERRNVSQEAQSAKQMAFQERMSSTAHQREVKDLRAAGLNPILSATGGSGATTPGGAQAQIMDVVTPAVSSAFQARKLNAEIKNLTSSTAANVAREKLTLRQAGTIAPLATAGEAVGSAVARAVQGLKAGSGFRNAIADMFSLLAKPEIERRGSIGIRRPEGRIIYSDK